MDRRAFLLALSTATAVAAAKPRAIRAASRASLPFELLDNRPFVTVQLQGNNHKIRDTVCWFDTGGGNFLITKDVANELNLAATGLIQSSDDEQYQPITPPRVTIAGTEIIIPTGGAMVSLGGSTCEPGVRAEGFLPGHLLRNHRVLIDYTNRRFALDAPPDGEATHVPVAVDPHSGFVRLDIVVDGERVGVLLDTGASLTMFSRSFIDKLMAKHPDWKSASGAYGPANMSGNKSEVDAKMLRIPQIDFGGISLHDVVAVSRRAGVFEQWMSSMVPAPIVGALGGNALRNLRLQIDYPQNEVTAIRTDQTVAHEFDMVPVVLDPTYHGYQIVGVMEGAKFSIAHETLVGKTLVAVDGTPIGDLGIGEVFALLRGEPGSTHRLKVSSAGGSSTGVTATVSRII